CPGSLAPFPSKATTVFSNVPLLMPSLPLRFGLAELYGTEPTPAQHGNDPRGYRVPPFGAGKPDRIQASGPCSTSSPGTGGPGGVPSPNGRPPSTSRPCGDSQFDRSGPLGTTPVGFTSVCTA